MNTAQLMTAQNWVKIAPKIKRKYNTLTDEDLKLVPNKEEELIKRIATLIYKDTHYVEVMITKMAQHTGFNDNVL